MNYSFTGASLKSEDQIQFLRRLIPHLSPHRLTDLFECDVAISVGKPTNDVGRKPLILKWDHTCDNTYDADSIVIQDKDSIIDDRCVVINDGIDIEHKIKELPPGFQSISRDFDVVFVNSSPNWSKEDYVEDVFRDYESLKSEYQVANKRTALILMGDGVPNNPREGVDIYKVPWLEEEERLQLYSSANWTFSYSDRTILPCEVLESLSQGTPVIHRNQGVLKSVCGDYGFLLSDLPTLPPKYPWDLKRFDICEVGKKYSSLIESLVTK